MITRRLLWIRYFSVFLVFVSSTVIGAQSAETQNEITRKVETAKGQLVFRSAMKGSGEIIISLNGKFDGRNTKLEARVAANRQEVTWTGNGGVVTEGAREAIEQLAMELEERMLSSNVQPQEEWAFRLATFWSEVPRYVELNERRVIREKEQEQTLKPATEQSQNTATILLAANVLSTIGRQSCEGCNAPGGDGITYLRGSGKNVACPIGSYGTRHDACLNGSGHCYDSFVISGGCDRTRGCPGRCGAGCGLGGFGAYTKDCLEHDHCVGHDNAAPCCANDRRCGDEFFEAEGDYLFGIFNCNGCG